MSFKMEYLDESIKGLSKVYSRLFSYSFLVNNEIKYLINELESRYNEQDLYRNNSVSIMIEKLNESKLDNCQRVLENEFDILIDSINRSSALINDVLVNSDNEHEVLKTGRSEREKQALELRQKQGQEIKELDNKYKCLIKELEQKYNEIKN